MATLRELCRRPVYFLRAEQSVLEAARYMSERDIGAVAVLEKDRLSGIVSERDLLMRVAARGLDPATTPLSRIMTRNPVVVDVGEATDSCLQIMKQASCRHLPIVSEGTLAGMVSMRDLLEMHIGEAAEQIEMMKSYIHSVPPGTER